MADKSYSSLSSQINNIKYNVPSPVLGTNYDSKQILPGETKLYNKSYTDSALTNITQVIRSLTPTIINSDNYLYDSIKSEASTRKDQINDLSAIISADISSAISKNTTNISTVSTKLATEVTTRTNNVSALSSAITKRVKLNTSTYDAPSENTKNVNVIALSADNGDRLLIQYGASVIPANSDGISIDLVSAYSNKQYFISIQDYTESSANTVVAYSVTSANPALTETSFYVKHNLSNNSSDGFRWMTIGIAK